MKIKVLGCSGGIDSNARTTSFLLDEDTLIDAGTGVCDLPLAAQANIRQIFITHAHHDHIAALPLIADSMVHSLDEHNLSPIKIYARESVIDDLHRFVFNNHISPAFMRLPRHGKPVLECIALDVGDKIVLSDNRVIEAIPAVHSVPSVGYAIHQHGQSWVFTGDTGRNPLLWKYINQLPEQGQILRWLVIETTFSSFEQTLADLTGHYTAQSLLEDVRQLQLGDFDFYLTHLKPSERSAILKELGELQTFIQKKNCNLQLLGRGHVFDSADFTELDTDAPYEFTQIGMDI